MSSSEQRQYVTNRETLSYGMGSCGIIVGVQVATFLYTLRRKDALQRDIGEARRSVVEVKESVARLEAAIIDRQAGRQQRRFDASRRRQANSHPRRIAFAISIPAQPFPFVGEMTIQTTIIVTAYANQTATAVRSRDSQCSRLSDSANQLASMMFSEEPTVLQVRLPSVESIRTRTTEPVPLPWSTTRTL